MPPMPPAEMLEPFVGDEVAQVRLDPFGLQLSFLNGRQLAIEHVVEHVEPDGTRHRYDCQASERPPLLLHRLLLRPVASVEREELSFTLRFEDGAALVVHAALDGHESGHIVVPGEPTGWVVF